MSLGIKTENVIFLSSICESFIDRVLLRCNSRRTHSGFRYKATFLTEDYFEILELKFEIHF